MMVFFTHHYFFKYVSKIGALLYHKNMGGRCLHQLSLVQRGRQTGESKNAS